MSPMQAEIIRALGVQPTIDPEAEIVRRVTFLKQHVLSSNRSGLLIAISGGVDSAVVAGLCHRATTQLRAETGQDYRTFGVLQPYGTQQDIADSHAVVASLQLSDVVEMNIAEAVDDAALECEFSLKKLGFPRHLSLLGKGNIKARMRMVMQYALAQELNVLVVGTDHASEAITGFFTKYGDGAVDLTPLSSLSKRQVYLLAQALHLPDIIRTKAPSAGLWAGQTDEEELGISYEDNSDYLEGKTIDPIIAARLEERYTATAHKRNPIPGI